MYYDVYVNTAKNLKDSLQNIYLTLSKHSAILVFVKLIGELI